jgi:hypothetical protein
MKNLLIGVILLMSSIGSVYASGDNTKAFCYPDEGGKICFEVIKKSMARVGKTVVQLERWVYSDDEPIGEYTHNEVRINCATKKTILLSIDDVPADDNSDWEDSTSGAESDMVEWVCNQGVPNFIDIN